MLSTKIQFITTAATLHFHTIGAPTETLHVNDPRIHASLARNVNRDPGSSATTDSASAILARAGGGGPASTSPAAGGLLGSIRAVALNSSPSCSPSFSSSTSSSTFINAMAPAQILHQDENSPSTNSASNSTTKPVHRGPRVKYVKRRETTQNNPSKIGWELPGSAASSSFASSSAKGPTSNNSTQPMSRNKNSQRHSLPSTANPLLDSSNPSYSTQPAALSSQEFATLGASPSASSPGFIFPRGLDPTRRKSHTSSPKRSQETPRTKRKREVIEDIEAKDAFYRNPNKRPNKIKHALKLGDGVSSASFNGSTPRALSQSSKSTPSLARSHSRSMASAPIDLTRDDDTPPPPPASIVRKSVGRREVVDLSMNDPTEQVLGSSHLVYLPSESTPSSNADRRIPNNVASTDGDSDDEEVTVQADTKRGASEKRASNHSPTQSTRVKQSPPPDSIPVNASPSLSRKFNARKFNAFLESFAGDADCDQKLSALLDRLNDQTKMTEGKEANVSQQVLMNTAGELVEDDHALRIDTDLGAILKEANTEQLPTPNPEAGLEHATSGQAESGAQDDAEEWKPPSIQIQMVPQAAEIQDEDEECTPPTVQSQMVSQAAGAQKETPEWAAPPVQIETVPRAVENVLAMDMSSLSISNKVEVAVAKCLEEFGDENEYNTRMLMKRARLGTQKPTLAQMQGEGTDGPRYMFEGFEPLAMKTIGKFTATKNTAVFMMELPNAAGFKSKQKVSCMAPVYTFDAEDTMPEYTHYVTIKQNILARNVKTMQVWPYFGDDFVSTDANLHHNYSMDIKSRARKIKRLQQAQQYEEFAEGALEDLGITWEDVLRFLLERDPDVGSDPEFLRLKRIRDNAFCKEDFYRPGRRTDDVLALLPVSTPQKLATAAVLCEIFQSKAEFPLWHIARRHMFDLKPPESPPDPAKSMEEKTCRICLRFMCQLHGEYEEVYNEGETNCNPNDIPKDIHGDGGDGNDVLATELVHPPEIDRRVFITFPPDLTEEDTAVHGAGDHSKKDRRSVRYWNGYEHRAEERDQFYPCHHPGVPCEVEKCTCFRNKVPCEKSCSCPNSCVRKWQGCSCRKKGKNRMLCYEDDTCACFQLGRECDPDLCGSCSAHSVLDPVNRYDQTKLAQGCRNVNLQRGVFKPTLLGDSAIHGFGLFAGADIGAHEFVGEYVGEVITKTEADRRGAVYMLQKLSYLFSLNKSLEIDSTYFGNKMRFINHAGGGQANLYPRIQMANTVHRIGFYSNRPISYGEELFFDYGPQFPDDQLGEPVKGKKSAPHVRNANLVRDEFYGVEQDEDEHGVRRYRKTTTKGRGSALGRPPSSRQRGGARPNSGRKPSKRGPKPPAVEKHPDISSTASDHILLNSSDAVAPPDDAGDVDMGDSDNEIDTFQPDDEDSEAPEEVTASDDSASMAEMDEDDDDDDEPYARDDSDSPPIRRGNNRRSFTGRPARAAGLPARSGSLRSGRRP